MRFNIIDQGWVDALRRFMGDGKGPVPVWKNPDGTVNAQKTVECAFGLYNIKPVLEENGTNTGTTGNSDIGSKN
jgi:hypothetical protein